MTHRVYLHPLPVRFWHWVNAAGFVLMILTGLQIRYVGVIDVVSFHTAVVAHNWIGFVLIANYFVWLIFYLVSDKKSNYLQPRDLRKFFAESIAQVQYYAYGMFVGMREPHHITPYDKFNPLQVSMYQAVMVLLVPVQFYTGLLLWDLKRFAGQVDFFGGVRVIDSVHVLIFIFFVFYIIAHPYLGTLGPTRTSQYKAMLTGYDEVEEETETA